MPFHSCKTNPKLLSTSLHCFSELLDLLALQNHFALKQSTTKKASELHIPRSKLLTALQGSFRSNAPPYLLRLNSAKLNTTRHCSWALMSTTVEPYQVSSTLHCSSELLIKLALQCHFAQLHTVQPTKGETGNRNTHSLH
ncbi:hypothetical protein MRB53_021248 [Persea americana]|uniref:Uncharacterized protein n=1 Tax=Persea americana TaxID=3435 RepID=A0ACC2L320_PERAE|nr:hypothetical protein MRB53_021248 [Persea americana]